ncbi:MAG: hypothetical protein QM813_09415 [Verrucomicrobiota bacterium]
MTPSTIVRRPRGPFTFAGITALLLEREPAKPAPRANYHKCVACQDDGSPCGLPARYLDFKRGGHVCLEHKPDRKKEVLQLV